jgi:hypothetical protein
MDQMDATHSMPQMPGNCKAKRENLTSENAGEIFALIRRLEGGPNGRVGRRDPLWLGLAVQVAVLAKAFSDAWS